jgi:hypothetical protein
MKIGTITPTIYGDGQSSIHTFQGNCPGWVKFGIWDLNIMLVITVSFMKISARKAMLFLWV